MIKSLHYLSGIFLALFAGLHLFNHFTSILGPDKHIEYMLLLRLVYRNIFFEVILLLAISVQIYSGIKLFVAKRKVAVAFFDKLQTWSGLYLAIFFVFHLSAVFAGRYVLHLDTNIYFGIAGLNTFPFNLFFLPYYSLAMLSFFSHIAAVHHSKMKSNILGFTVFQQSVMVLILGAFFTSVIIIGLTNSFNGYPLPQQYNVLIGK